MDGVYVRIINYVTIAAKKDSAWKLRKQEVLQYIEQVFSSIKEIQKTKETNIK